MKYNLDENGYVANYALVGDVENGAEYTGAIPDGFSVCPQAYRLANGVLMLDGERYAALTAAPVEPPQTDSTAALEQRIAELEAVIDALVGSETA